LNKIEVNLNFIDKRSREEHERGAKEKSSSQTSRPSRDSLTAPQSFLVAPMRRFWRKLQLPQRFLKIHF